MKTWSSGRFLREVDKSIAKSKYKCLLCDKFTNDLVRIDAWPYHVCKECSYYEVKFIDSEGNEVGRMTGVGMSIQDKCQDPNGCQTNQECHYSNKCLWLGPTHQLQSRIPEFHQIMSESLAIHIKKNQDYASSSNPFSNFERSAELMSWFTGEIDKSFANLVGTKLARIAELSEPGREPNNESLDDSFVDLVTYCALWGAYKRRMKK